MSGRQNHHLPTTDRYLGRLQADVPRRGGCDREGRHAADLRHHRGSRRRPHRQGRAARFAREDSPSSRPPSRRPNRTRRSQWALAVQARATKMRPMSLERFEAAVAVSTAARKGESVPVKNDPPIIHVSKVPAMLILVDGDPVYRDVSGTPLTRVLNTRPLILKDCAGKHYLKVFDGWMTAPALTGPWTVAGSVPGDVDKALKAVIELKVADLLVGGDPNDPSERAITQETGPTDLRRYQASGTDRLRGRSQVRAARRHAADVRGEHDRQHVRLLGGSEGVHARLRPLVPRSLDAARPVGVCRRLNRCRKTSRRSPTRARRKTSRHRSRALSRPKKRSSPTVCRRPLKSSAARRSSRRPTTVTRSSRRSNRQRSQYVVNSSLPVLAVGSPVEYFGVQNGVWFVSNNLRGPWLVATTVPSEIYSIPG